MEIEDKKDSDNVIADHLSRLEKLIEDERGTEIEENFPDEQLVQISIKVPWYADIMNYLSCFNATRIQLLVEKKVED